MFNTTLPNGMLLALRVSTGVAAFSWRATDLEVVPVDAVKVAVCALVTDATLAVNAALVAVAGTIKELGSVTAPLELARATLVPPEGAEPDKPTVH